MLPKAVERIKIKTNRTRYNVISTIFHNGRHPNMAVAIPMITNQA